MKVRNVILAFCLLLCLMIPVAAEQTSAYITLSEDTTFALNGESLTIDLAGYDLTVTGQGNILLIDSANDTYDAAACGSLVCSEAVQVAPQATAPNGNRYVTIEKDGAFSAHRLEMELTHVTLRTVGAGLYYRATYHCDAAVEAAVTGYGVVLSLQDMPGADFKTEKHNAWTALNTGFASGVSVTSGAVVNILSDRCTAEQNSDRSNRKIYANPYLELQDQVLVGDEEQGLSLADALTLADGGYADYTIAERLQLDAFYDQWKGNGLAATYTQIGTVADSINQNLTFDPGTANAYCPVCEKKVTWILVDQATYGSGYGIIKNNGEHVCLVEDIVYSGNSEAFISAPGQITNTTGKVACLHLNGHNITSLNHRAIAGSSGIFNVMGNGVVLGNYNASNQRSFGATVNTNNNRVMGTLNFYGGTYTTLDSNAQNTVISVGNNGGRLHIFAGAKVIGNRHGITVGTANLTYAELTLRGKISGSITAAGADLSKGFSSTITIDGGVISGGIDLGKNNAISLSGAPVIGGMGLKLAAGATVNLGDLHAGAMIPVQAEGAFTQPAENARNYERYFTAVSADAEIGSQDGILYCATGYQKKLALDSDGNGYCMACGKTVPWTALTSAAITLEKNAHYYLPADMTYTGTSAAYLTGSTTSAGTVCLHLNGYNMIASKYRAINVAKAQLNVMGLGVISGNCQNSNPLGATLYSGYGDGKLKLYSGCIKKAEGNTDYALVQYKGAFELLPGTIVSGGYKLAKAATDTPKLSCKGQIIGTTLVNGGTLTLSGAPKVQFEVAEGVLIQLDALTAGAQIGVQANGCFTTITTQAGQYLQYFKATAAGKTITVQANALHCVAENTEDDTLYILTAAASNSHYFMDELYGVLAAAGVKAKVCNLMKSSTGINAFYNHWKNGEKVFELYIYDENGKTVMQNMGLDDALALYPWDVFNMQEGTAPHRTTTPEQAAADRQVAHAALVAHIRETIPNAKLYYQEIWSPDIGFDRFNYQMTSKEQQLDFSARIKTYTDIVCKDFDLDTIPCGSAWVIARESELLQNMCARLSVNNGEGDYYHDGDIGGGQYLNACVWFETLTGQSCIGNTFRPDYELSEEKIALLQQAAHQAVANLQANN